MTSAIGPRGSTVAFDVARRAQPVDDVHEAHAAGTAQRHPCPAAIVAQRVAHASPWALPKMTADADADLGSRRELSRPARVADAEQDEVDRFVEGRSDGKQRRPPISSYAG